MNEMLAQPESRKCKTALDAEKETALMNETLGLAIPKCRNGPPP